MVPLYNYTSLKTEDTKIYDIGGYSIPGGLSLEFTKVVAPVIVVFVIIGMLVGKLFHIPFFNFLDSNFKLWYTLLWTGGGALIGFGLWHIQFVGYRLYQYILAYIKPKKCYMNDWRHTEVKLTNFKIKTLVRHIL